MDNTEGTSQPEDSVETGRGASANWNTLAEDYERLGNLTKVARLHHVRYQVVRDELIRQGVPIKPRGHVKGQKKSQAWRDASAKNWNDPAWREVQRKKWLERLPSMQASRNGGSPLEKYLHRALRKEGISFSTQRPILGRYVADILITQKPVVIEADGNMHLHAKMRERDARRDADMRAAGYEVFRFHGKAICNDADGCIRQVIEAAGLTRDAEPVYDIRNGLMAEANPRWKGGKPEWTCANCGVKFRSWPRGYGKPCITCSRACQVEWQRKTRASVANRRPWGTARQMVVQSGLHEPRKDVQRSAEMTDPATLW
jgi:very-short-patch-repair endonuclease